MAADFPRDAAAEQELSWVQQVVLGIRQIRGEMDIAPARRLPLLLQNAGAAEQSLAQRHRALLEHLAGVESIRALGPDERAPPAAAALINEFTLLVPMAGLIEPAIELQRLSRRLQKVSRNWRAPMASSPTTTSYGTRPPTSLPRSGSAGESSSAPALRC